MNPLGQWTPEETETYALNMAKAAMNAAILEIELKHGFTRPVDFQCSVSCDHLPKDGFTRVTFS